MKIAFIVGGFPKLSETFILNQITGLIDRGCEVDIYADRSTNESKLHADVKKYNLLSRTRYVNRPDNQLLSICKLSRLLLTNLHKDPAILLRSLRSSNYDTQHAFSRLMLPYMALAFLDKKKYDVVHCHFGPNGLKGAFLKKLGLLQGKIITTFHGQDITHYPATWGEHFYDQLFSTGDLFLPISDCWRKKLVELGCDKERIIVHRMGVDCKKFRFASRHLNSDEKVRFLTVARLVEKKGIEYAVRAVARLTKIKPNVEYVVVGDGPLKENLQQLTKELSVESVVKLVGWKEQDEIVDLLNSASILLAPSVVSKDGDQEGIPVGLMEAMAVGLPVVSTYHSGIPELVEDNVSGLLIPERDVDALVDKMIYLVEHPEIWAEMGRAGRSVVEDRYNSDHLNDQLVKLYKELVG